MSELIKIAPNGQWTLSKASNFPKYGVTQDVYSGVHLNQQKQLLTDEELKASHADMHGYYKQNDLPVQKMVNPTTGQEETHFLMQRGINEQDGDMEPSARGPNLMDYATDPNHVLTNTHSIVAVSEDGIAGDDGKIPGYVDGGPKGAHLKFWVPQSHIVGRRKHLADHHFDPQSSEAMAGGDETHVMIRPGKFPLHSRTMWRNMPPRPGEEYSRMVRQSVHIPKKK